MLETCKSVSFYWIGNDCFWKFELLVRLMHFLLNESGMKSTIHMSLIKNDRGEEMLINVSFCMSRSTALDANVVIIFCNCKGTVPPVQVSREILMLTLIAIMIVLRELKDKNVYFQKFVDSLRTTALNGCVHSSLLISLFFSSSPVVDLFFAFATRWKSAYCMLI